MHNKFAGKLYQNAEGYYFTYDKDYLNTSNSTPISLTLPFKTEAYHSKTLFPFFDGLIPDGWYLDTIEKINPHDRMAMLLGLCRDCMGAVSVIPEKGGKNE